LLRQQLLLLLLLLLLLFPLLQARGVDRAGAASSWRPSLPVRLAAPLSCFWWLGCVMASTAPARLSCSNKYMPLPPAGVAGGG
jgi:hypothetical protein